MLDGGHVLPPELHARARIHGGPGPELIDVNMRGCCSAPFRATRRNNFCMAVVRFHAFAQMLGSKIGEEFARRGCVGMSASSSVVRRHSQHALATEYAFREA